MPDEPSPASRRRRIAHLDMDAFFASVELLRYPQLTGQPMVIGGGRRNVEEMLARLRREQPQHDWTHEHLAQIPPGFFPRLRDYVGRGVVTTATYAARPFGIGSAMGLMKAARLCPHAILLPADFDEYRRLSRAFKDAVAEIAPRIEDRGIDEIYLDVSDLPDAWPDGGRRLAQRIQRRVLEATGLTCSIGVAPNKLLAKLASEFDKPNGITVLHEADLEPRIWPLPCRKVNGIGPKADAKLAAHGIATIGELARRERGWLIDRFGRSHGAWLHDVAHGRDERPVVTHSEPVSVSRETTFERDLHAQRDRAELGAIFTGLCEKVAADLARKGYVGKTIGIKLRFDDFQVVTRDRTIAQFTADARTIRQAAGSCLQRAPLLRPLRLLGVRVASLSRADEAGAKSDVARAPRSAVGPDHPLEPAPAVRSRALF